MTGERDRTGKGESTVPGEEFHVPTVLARLDDDDPDVRCEAVATVRAMLEDEPARCLPTVPKLRRLLAESSADCRDAVAYCLAELAAASPEDVAPSTGTVVRYLETNPSRPGRTHALRCLRCLAEARPGAVVDHVDDITTTLEGEDGIDPRATRLFASLSTTYPGAVEPATSLLETALERAPATHAPTALPALRRLAGANPSLAPAVVDVVAPLTRHDERAISDAAVDCLRAIAHHDPSVLTEAPLDRDRSGDDREFVRPDC